MPCSCHGRCQFLPVLRGTSLNGTTVYLVTVQLHWIITKCWEHADYRKTWPRLLTLHSALAVFTQETQESIREAIESQPIAEQHEYILGRDGEGNTYMHFPQFCGADLRIYRQAPIEMPKMGTGRTASKVV